MSGHLTLPRIVIDGRVACDEVPHGFARYVAGLAAGLKRIEQDAPLAYEPIFLIQAGTAPRAFSGFGTCEVGAKFLSPFEILEIPRLLKKLGAAAYHSPTFLGPELGAMPLDLDGARSQSSPIRWHQREAVLRAPA